MGGNFSFPGGSSGAAQPHQRHTRRPQKKNSGAQSNISIKRLTTTASSTKIPTSFSPAFPSLLRLYKMNKVNDLLQIELEFISKASSSTYYKQTNKTQTDTIAKLRGSSQSIAKIQEIMPDDEHYVVAKTYGPMLYTRCLSIVDKELLQPNASVYLHDDGHRDIIVGVLTNDEDPSIANMKLAEKPKDSYADIGGLETAIQELRETIQLPLTNPEYFTDLGIEPPRSCILYGPSGSGKSLLARACAHETSATFLKICGSEMIQKYSGEGPRLVRELFKTARELAPSIVFIDEVDSVGGKRYDADSGGAREIQRTMLTLLNELDGFDRTDSVKVILATNHIENLDSALIRAGRVDRKIFVGLPQTVEERRRIFEIHSKKMCLAEDVMSTALDAAVTEALERRAGTREHSAEAGGAGAGSGPWSGPGAGAVGAPGKRRVFYGIDEVLSCKEDLSGADVRAICLEAGLLALRDRRMRVCLDDFRKARDRVLYKKVEAVGDLYT